MKGFFAMDFSSKDIALKIKQLCKDKKIPIKSVLEGCSINRNFIYDLENRGSVPSIEAFYNLSNYLNCSMDYLLGRTDIVNDDDLKAVRQFTANTYKTMLSAEGVRVIKTYLAEYMNNAEEEVWEKLNDIGLSFADIKAALTNDNMLDNKLFSKLDDVFSTIETNFYEIFKQHFANSESSVSLAEFGDIAAEGGEINRAKTAKTAVTSINTDD